MEEKISTYPGIKMMTNDMLSGIFQAPVNMYKAIGVLRKTCENMRKPATHPTRPSAKKDTHVVDLHVISHWPKKAAASIEFHAINLKFFGEQ